MNERRRGVRAAHRLPVNNVIVVCLSCGRMAPSKGADANNPFGTFFGISRAPTAVRRTGPPTTRTATSAQAVYSVKMKNEKTAKRFSFLLPIYSTAPRLTQQLPSSFRKLQSSFSWKLQHGPPCWQSQHRPST